MQWGFSRDGHCALCINNIESREHSHFVYSFTKRILEACDGLFLVIDVPIIWNEIVQWEVTNLKGKGFRPTFCKMVLWATIYHI